MAHTLPSHPSAPTCEELRIVALANARLHIKLAGRAASKVSGQFHWQMAKRYHAEATRWQTDAATAARRG